MRVKIFNCTTGILTDAKIIEPNKLQLPSITDGWRFNFRIHSKSANYKTFVLICNNTSGIIEGCLIFQLKLGVELYMAYIEIAPHNKGKAKIYENVAACLIAFACRLSFMYGKSHFKGWLAFDVMEV